MISAKHNLTRATSFMKESRESKRRASNDKLEVQIDDLKKVLWLSETQTSMKKINKSN